MSECSASKKKLPHGFGKLDEVIRLLFIEISNFVLGLTSLLASSVNVLAF